ncbi:enoyl-CoA hydratase/isomerase family protein [Marinobacterium arenosum]|uniref:enoyl-CoA hydratase/isomerase family protein n=1 Tax=Marinobacterium arenosum TaxID=2862496 RepID=UPI001C94585C|nr:enoyl-CoA hydratase/isomerase family protein [Marinobacterium arenosum]MBY4675065.1 enoyl-CoA hydratase/isomerase family protein [Marinobacterium arenosum]
MSNNFVLLEKRSDGVAELIINRPEVHNAFDDDVINQLIEQLEATNRDPEVRVLVLRSNGKSFSAGADLAWMKRMAQNSHQENIEDAGRLARLMETLNNHAKPTIGLVQGAAYGGAVGLAACCDIVIAAETSQFCLSEVKIGLIPAVISPYVVRAIGERQARRYFVTAEPFSARQAQQYGLVHEVVATPELLDDACQRFVSQLRRNSPQAMHAAKELVFAVSGKPIEQTVIDDTARRIADIRVSDEGQEGLGSFLEKRKPNWIQE